MISVIKNVAAFVAGSSLREDEEVVCYYRGFRCAFLPNAGHEAGVGSIEPVSDAAIAAWDQYSGLSLSHEQPATSAKAFFPRARSLCDRVLERRH